MGILPMIGGAVLPLFFSDREAVREAVTSL